jgi:hypothetical protein
MRFERITLAVPDIVAKAGGVISQYVVDLLQSPGKVGRILQTSDAS